ncbi:putative Ig domain-containing protein [Pseudoalteromonas phenolica]|uniref:putative Ig domain-containing protein n=1 Tax=Pseudoalteromonas phenolica TaxID=161398 RepID=UPI00384E04FF
MKKTNQATLLLVALLGLTACGGGSSDNSQPEKGVSQNQDEVSIKGSVEKGPFVIGSAITINVLNEKGENTDSTIVTKTTDNLGNFEFKVPKGSLIQITASGYYRNEITGGLSEDVLTLRSIFKATENTQQNANVNILTHLTSNRIIELIKAGETDFNKAIKQAEAEFTSNFKSIISGTKEQNFSDLSIYKDDDSDASAYLLALSSMMYQHALDKSKNNDTSENAELTALLNLLEDDFGSDGIVNNEAELIAIRKTQRYIDPLQIEANLSDWLGDNSNYSIPNINEYLDNDLDGIANITDTDDDNDGIADEDDSSPNMADFIIDNQHVSLAEDETVSIEIATNNPLGADEPIKFELMSDVSSGSLKVDYPNITYTPVENYNGKDEFTFKLIQGNVESKLVTFSVDVTAVNDAPTINGSPESEIIADQEYIFIPDANDVDLDKLTFLVENQPSWLSFDHNTGELRGTASNSNVALYENISIKVKDDTETVELPKFSLRVKYSALDAPINFENSATATSETLKPVFLSWNEVSFAHEYELQISENDLFTQVLKNETLQSTSLTLQLSPNKYYIRVRSINPDGLEGNWSETQLINVGVFETALGDTGQDRPKKIIAAKDGGYFILASTNSDQINANVDSEGDDWLIKLDASGKLEWQYVLNNGGEPWLVDIAALDDNSLVAVGFDNSKHEAVSLKLNNAGTQEWFTTYSAVNDEHRYYFNSVAIANGDIYISGTELGECSGGCSFKSSNLHTIDLNTGQVSEALTIPEIQDYKIYEHSLSTNAEGKLVVFGYIVPAVISPQCDPEFAEMCNFYAGGPFIHVLDSNLQTQMVWMNTGNSHHISADKLIQDADKNYVLIGASQGEGPNIAVVSQNGEENSIGKLGGFDITYDSDSKALSLASDGLFYTVVEKRDIGSELLVFDKELSIIDRKYIDGEDHTQNTLYPRGMLSNPDGTTTFLFGKWVREQNANDIVIRKIN